MTCPHCSSGQIVMGLPMPPRRGTIRAAILRLVRAAGPQGLTVEDLEALTHLAHQSVSARVHDLGRAGAIEAAGRRTNRSGKQAICWRVPTALEAESAR